MYFLRAIARRFWRRRMRRVAGGDVSEHLGERRSPSGNFEAAKKEHIMGWSFFQAQTRTGLVESHEKPR